jgi:hypothetical protein
MTRAVRTFQRRRKAEREAQAREFAGAGMGRAAFIRPDPRPAQPELRDPRFAELDAIIAEDDRQARQRIERLVRKGARA